MSQQSYKLLVVEDETDVCTYVQSYFGRRGFIVSTTGSGAEALPMIKAGHPDVVLLDLSLRDMSGEETLRALRAYDQLTKVIVITGQQFPAERVEGIKQLGISGYKQKPVILEDVVLLVYNILGVPPPTREQTPIATAIIPGSHADAAHELSNLLGIIRGQCEDFTLNVEEGIYKHKSPQELLTMSIRIMTDIQATVDRAVPVVDSIKKS